LAQLDATAMRQRNGKAHRREQPPSTRICVENLLCAARAEQLGAHFAQYGEVRTVVIETDDAGRSLGQVTSDMPVEHARAAIELLNDQPFQGRRLYIVGSRMRY
jgi:RNA recognition motif-containing protein